MFVSFARSVFLDVAKLQMESQIPRQSGFIIFVFFKTNISQGKPCLVDIKILGNWCENSHRLQQFGDLNPEERVPSPSKAELLAGGEGEDAFSASRRAAEFAVAAIH